ncbi:single-stranded DNA-binding protein [Sphingobium cupriresistens]|uniref:Single-stranded DNA-binding protein n=1 Tax=Sphingobium cupriresistens LL01 TaxID=1420583 RepID=A0A0J7XSG0_9SPHN|nr:single-stranded DNA-binding protein [Sphingobium cupriresistens]KMS54579.1 single-stranded DNA-binding protein [Sphingobium cupriresistens LL01]
MTACINKVSVLGFLGEDPKSADMQGGGTVVRLRVATTEHWTAAGGERKQATEWHSVVIYNEALGKRAMSYLRKGSAVYVEGPLRYRKYTGRDQIERTASEIVVPKFGGDLKLMDKRQDDAARQEVSGRNRAAGERSDLDDEVPF